MKKLLFGHHEEDAMVGILKVKEISENNNFFLLQDVFICIMTS